MARRVKARPGRYNTDLGCVVMPGTLTWARGHVDMAGCDNTAPAHDDAPGHDDTARAHDNAPALHGEFEFIAFTFGTEFTHNARIQRASRVRLPTTVHTLKSHTARARSQPCNMRVLNGASGPRLLLFCSLAVALGPINVTTVRLPACKSPLAAKIFKPTTALAAHTWLAQTA